jgi:hypothetical protein
MTKAMAGTKIDVDQAEREARLHARDTELLCQRLAFAVRYASRDSVSLDLTSARAILARLGEPRHGTE